MVLQTEPRQEAADRTREVGRDVERRALVVHLALNGWSADLGGGWWLYIGGLLGCVFIAAQAVIVRMTGVLLMGLALLAGQLVASVALDLLLPVSGTGLHVVTVVGSALVLVAVVVAAWPGRAVRAS